MKIAGLSPHFVVEASPAAEKSEAKQTASELGLRVVKPEEPSATKSGVSLDQETLAGLKRLSSLLKEKKKKEEEPDSHEKKRAFRSYLVIFNCHDPTRGRGENLDEYF